MEHLDMRDLLASEDCATVDVDDVEIAYEGPYTRTGPLSAEAWGNLLAYVATLVYARPAIGKPTRAWVDVEAASGVSSRRCMVYPDTLDPPSYQQYAGMHHTVVVHVDGEEAPRAVCLDRVSVRGAGACL
ncbi:MAG: hypothetical protein IPK80_02585 [Nannocystis sp.]|nr:hypothetical protein [Nannocystis sp.]